MLNDPEIQSIIKPTDVQTFYKAKNENTRAYLVQFADLPPEAPTHRTRFIEKIQKLMSSIEEAKAIIEQNEPLVVRDFRESEEYAEIQALIARLIENIIPDIKNLKAGKITETEFWAKVNAQIQQIVATIKAKIMTWLNRNRQALARIQQAKKDMTDAQTALNTMLRECPELKRKYNIVDTPEGVKQ
jgi:DNA repair exonuclease SbcCD ATPase subunit